jgi:hypothetical protein
LFPHPCLPLGIILIHHLTGFETERERERGESEEGEGNNSAVIKNMSSVRRETSKVYSDVKVSLRDANRVINHDYADNQIHSPRTDPAVPAGEAPASV